MSKIIVSNWKEVYKSLAVILPTVIVALYTGLVEIGYITPLDPMYTTAIVAVAGALGWTIKQPYLRTKP